MTTRTVFAPALADGERYYWDFEVHPDGQRLLMVRMAANGTSQAVSRLVVVENFFEELKAKVPR